MELTSVSLNACRCFFSVKPPASTSRDCSIPLPLLRNSTTNTSSLSLKFTGSQFPRNTVRLPGTYIAAAVVGDRTVVPNDSVKENTLSAEQSDPAANHEAPTEDAEEKDDRMVRISDKLIEVFMINKPNPTDWRRLLAFSRNWSEISPHFYKRCQERADNEDDPGKKHKILRFRRKLKEIDDDVQRHNELFAVIKKAPSDVNEIVMRRRKDFTKEFFVHLYTVAQSYQDNPDEKNDVENIGKICMAAVQAYDVATESVEAMNAAQLKFEDIMNSPSLEAACRKIDNMAEKNQLDPALALIATKAWSAAKETNLVKDEAKDILYHLYKKGIGNLQRLVPKEIRIVKYLLTIKDPEERLSALKDAFTPGEELQGEDIDCLYTTPEILQACIKQAVDAYHFSREGTVLKDARDLMNPNIVKNLEEINKLIQDKFM